MCNSFKRIDLKSYEPPENEVKIYTLLYNTSTGLFHGLTQKLRLITVRGDEQEFFAFSAMVTLKKKATYCTVT